MKSEDVIVRPILTEKSTVLRTEENKYSFVVSKSANKMLVAQAISEMFDVKPVKVNIANVKGKKKRVRYRYGYTASFKKAVVTLKKGDKIAIFEGA